MADDKTKCKYQFDNDPQPGCSCPDRLESEYKHICSFRDPCTCKYSNIHPPIHRERIIAKSISLFAKRMADRMIDNLEEKGLSYKDRTCDIPYLESCIEKTIVKTDRSVDSKYFIDVANYCMMIVEKLEQDK